MFLETCDIPVYEVCFRWGGGSAEGRGKAKAQGRGTSDEEVRVRMLSDRFLPADCTVSQQVKARHCSEFPDILSDTLACV